MASTKDTHSSGTKAIAENTTSRHTNYSLPTPHIDNNMVHTHHHLQQPYMSNHKGWREWNYYLNAILDGTADILDTLGSRRPLSSTAEHHRQHATSGAAELIVQIVQPARRAFPAKLRQTMISLSKYKVGRKLDIANMTTVDTNITCKRYPSSVAIEWQNCEVSKPPSSVAINGCYTRIKLPSYCGCKKIAFILVTIICMISIFVSAQTHFNEHIAVSNSEHQHILVNFYRKFIQLPKQHLQERKQWHIRVFFHTRTFSSIQHKRSSKLITLRHPWVVS